MIRAFQTEASTCEHRLDAVPSEARGGGEGAASRLEGLTPQEVPELFHVKPEELGETLEFETAASLPGWLDIPLLPGAEPMTSPSAQGVVPSRPPASTAELPCELSHPLPSELPPASISLVSLPPQPSPILDARRVNRLQDLAGRGPWGEADLGGSAQRREVLKLSRELPSILLAECRPGATSTALIQPVERWPRFVAGGQAPTDGDPISAIRRACESISLHTGRRLFDERGVLLIPQQPTGQGVDRFVAVLGPPPLYQGLFTPAEDSRHQESLREGQLRAWSHAPLRSVPSCLATVIRYLGESYQANVVGLDVGVAQSWLVAWYEGHMTVIAGSGLISSAEGRGPAKALITSLWRQWTVESESILPRQPPTVNLIVARGPALVQGFTPLEIARLLIDVLQPTGICTLLWDRDGLAAPLGALAVNEPAIAACLLDGDAFLRLGTLIAPRGHPSSRRIALRFTLVEPEGRRQQGDVAAGYLRQVPLPPGRSARLTLHPAPGLDLGEGQPGRGAQAEVPGGLVGLLLDGRGRPLPALD